MKTNLVHILNRIQFYGKKSFEELKDLFAEDDIRKSEALTRGPNTWYPLTREVFYHFLHRVYDKTLLKYFVMPCWIV